MTTIILMFGFGMVVSYVISFVLEKVFLKSELTKQDCLNICDKSDY